MAMKLHSLDELMDRDIGPIGTPKRGQFCVVYDQHHHLFRQRRNQLKILPNVFELSRIVVCSELFMARYKQSIHSLIVESFYFNPNRPLGCHAAYKPSFLSSFSGAGGYPRKIPLRRYFPSYLGVVNDYT